MKSFLSKNNSLIQIKKKLQSNIITILNPNIGTFFYNIPKRFNTTNNTKISEFDIDLLKRNKSSINIVNIDMNKKVKEEKTNNGSKNKSFYDSSQFNNLHPYSLEILKHFKINGFNETQYNVYEAINCNLKYSVENIINKDFEGIDKEFKEKNDEIVKKSKELELKKEKLDKLDKEMNGEQKNSNEREIIQKEIEELLKDENMPSNNNHAMILSDFSTGRYFSVIFSIINRLLINQKVVMDDLVKVPDFDTENFFVSVDKEYQNIARNKVKNKQKKFLPPRGALIITQKFEFASQLYKVSRKLDFKGALRIGRIGTTLQNISPIIEHLDDDTEAQQSEIEEICKINLLLNTQWNLNDILFISPVMMEFVMNNLDIYDKFDINPEIIYIDDFDYLIPTEKNNENSKIIEKILVKYFSKTSDFYNPVNKDRTLLLSSMSYNLFDDLPSQINFLKERIEKMSMNNIISKANKTAKDEDNNIINNENQEQMKEIIPLEEEYSQRVNTEITDFMKKCLKSKNFYFKNIITWKNFMDFSPYNERNNTINYYFENCEDETKKLKRLLSIANNNDLSKRFLITVSTDKILKHVCDEFRKKKISFASIDREKKINERLRKLLDFSTNENNIMISTYAFIRGLNFRNVDNIVFYDLTDEPRDYIKILSKFSLNVEDRKNNCKLMELLIFLYLIFS